ncbi:MAG: hypothetical protein LBT59_16705 [Clostridiales bacterium]|jgi:hypothetical protein|nr:hypothetical protein [Clostridiales bacterium]
MAKALSLKDKSLNANIYKIFNLGYSAIDAVFESLTCSLGELEAEAQNLGSARKSIQSYTMSDGLWHAFCPALTRKDLDNCVLI